MGSDKELIAEIEKLDTGVKTKGLNADELTALLTKLREDAAAAEKAAAEAAAAKKKKAEAEKEKPPYEVSEGCAITSKRGVIDAGGAVEPSDLAGGKKAFDALVEHGKIKKN